MPADPIHPEQLDGQQRFRADLAAHLDSLPIGELAELLGELPRSRQQPFELGVLMIALNERLPDAYKLLPPAGQPGRARAAPLAASGGGRPSRRPRRPARRAMPVLCLAGNPAWPACP